MAKVALGPKGQAVASAVMSQLAPQIESIIGQICTAAGYSEPATAAQSYAAQVSGAYATAAATSFPALPPAGGSCSTGACGTNQMRPVPGGNMGTNGKSCCGSCASGSGQCSCSAESLGCSIGDTVNPVTGWQPVSPATGAPAAGDGVCVLPPGYGNCVPFTGDLAPCDVDRIIRTKRRFVATASTTGGTLADVTAALSPELDTPAGYSWYRITIPEVDVSHQGCPRSFVLTFVPAVGAPSDISSQIVEVAVQSERIYADGDGNYVHAWTHPRPADPDDLKITDGRCACERLCDCVIAAGSLAVDILVPTVPAGDAYDLQVQGVRDCWQINCGSCPPDDLCGREIIV